VRKKRIGRADRIAAGGGQVPTGMAGIGIAGAGTATIGVAGAGITTIGTVIIGDRARSETARRLLVM